jgi:hypothetical protein
MNQISEQHLRVMLSELSNHAPHNDCLLEDVKALAAMEPRSRQRHNVGRYARGSILVAATIGIAWTITTTVNSDVDTRYDPVGVTTLTPEKVRSLTELEPNNSADSADVERAWQLKWGVADIGLVSDNLTRVAQSYPSADAGLSYDPATLTFTQWVVADSGEAESLRVAVGSAFDTAAGGSNLDLSFGSSPTPAGAAEPLMKSLRDAYRSDPLWPESVDLTGEWSPKLGKFVIAAGEAHDDAAVLTYFERHWPNLVLLTPEVAPKFE